MSLLGKPCRKDHVFFCFRYRLAVQNFYFDSFNWYVPPLQSLSVRQIVQTVCDLFVPCVHRVNRFLGKAHIVQRNNMLCSIPARARWGVVCCKAAAALNAPSRSGSSPVYSLVFRFKVSAQSRTCSSKTALTSFCVI